MIISLSFAIIVSAILHILVRSLKPAAKKVWNLHKLSVKDVCEMAQLGHGISAHAKAVAIKATIYLAWPAYATFDRLWHLRTWHEGLLLSYALISDKNESKQACLFWQSKLKWRSLFKEYDLDTPRLFAVAEGRNVITYEPPDDIVAVKPDRSCCGRGFQLMQHTQLESFYFKTLHVVEEYIHTSPSSHYRIVTAKEKHAPSFVLASFKATSQDYVRLVSNAGVTERVPKSLFGATADQLTRMHDENFAIACISWDLLLKNDKFILLEGNIPGAICWKQDFSDILQEQWRVVHTWL